MGNELEFLNKLKGLLEIATKNGGKITKEEVEAYFKEDTLSQEQMILVFDYLLAQKVAIKGYIKLEETKEKAPVEFSKEELDYLKLYEEDLKAMRPAKVGELEELYQKICAGDALAKARLTELYLDKVVSFAKEVYLPQVFLGDLIQEGNISLVVALESVTEDTIKDVKELDDYLVNEILQGMQMLIEESGELKSRDERIIEKVSHLDESITKLTEDFGRKITIDELALHMEISEEEILDILKLAGEDVDGEEEE